MTLEINQDGPMQRRPVIFLSYSWEDAAEVANQIKASLEEVGYDVWIYSEHIRPDDEHFRWLLEEALEKCRLFVALLSPYSVRLEGDVGTVSRMSMLHNELILAVRKNLPVVPVTVIKCNLPLPINHYDPIDFTAWQSSPAAYQQGIQDILQWIREALADPPRRRYRAYVDNLPAARLTFPEELTAEGNFVGREWLMDRLEAWLDGNGRCFLIEAEPGAGKTALVSELVRRNSGGRVLAYHFCNLQNEDTVDARRFVRSIASMLCGTVPEYLLRQRSSEDLVLALQPSNPASTMLWQGILAPLHSVTMDGTRYIILNAVDEAAGTREESIPQLLSEQLDNFPAWLKLVATTRRDDRVVSWFHEAERCFLGESEARQQDDLTQYIARRLSEPDLGPRYPNEGTRRRVAATIAQRSAGSFRYAASVFDELSRGTLDIGEIDRLPRSLAHHYEHQAAAQFPAPSDFALARKVLSVIFVAFQPLTRGQLALITGLDQHNELGPLLDRLNCFVAWETDSAGERAYRPAHKSMADWLMEPANSDRFRVDPAEGRDLILAHCRKWATHHERYALTHLIAHLMEGSFMSEALILLRNGFFRERRAYIDPRYDLDDARSLTLALVAGTDQAAILELAQTNNVWQRDGVASALQAAPEAEDDFVDSVVAALQQAR
jgi:hypothetical protein